MSDLKKIQKEIDDMEKALEVPEAGLDDLRSDPPPTNAPDTNPPPTDPQPTDAPDTPAPPTDAPDTEPAPTDAPATKPPEEDPRDKELRELREENERLKKPSPTQPPPTKAPSTDPPISEEDFLGETDLDELTRDPKLFNALLNKIYKKGREDTRTELKGGIETVVRSIPDIVKNVAAVQSQLVEANQRFYKDNEDLVPWSTSVAAVMEEFIAQNPDKPYTHFIKKDEKTGESLLSAEVRKRLNLIRKATDKKKKGDPPLLPKKKGGQRQTSTPNLSELDQEMEDMDKALGYD